MKAVVYARASTELQGTERQVQNCLKFASEHGYTVEKVFSEIGSTQSDRPIYSELLSFIDGKEDVTIIVDSADRLSRNPLEMIDLSEKQKIITTKNQVIKFEQITDKIHINDN